MPTPIVPSYFLVTANYSSFAPGVALFADVLFEPVMADGSMIPATGMTTPTGFFPFSVAAKIVGGVLVAADGESSVQLLSNASLGLGTPLVYRVSFENVSAIYQDTTTNAVIDSQTVQVAPILFTAPTDETPVNLVSVAPASIVWDAFAAGVRSAAGATVVVAAYNSSPSGRSGANFVCAGVNDELVINEAINSLPSEGGKVVLLEGNYTCTGPILVDTENVFIEGQGQGYSTQIGAPSGTVSRQAALIAGVTAPCNYFGIRNVWFNLGGGGSTPKAGTGHGLVITGDAYVIENVTVQYCSGDPIHYGQDLLTPSLTTSIAATSNAYSLDQLAYPATDTINVVNTAGFASSGSVIIRKSSGRFAFVTYTGTTVSSFTGCVGNWSGTSTFVLATGDEVYQTQQVFNGTTYNTLVQGYGGYGYYIDWHFASCEWILARGQGNALPVTATGSQHGFYVQGTLLKFIACHPFFNSGWGMYIGDTYSFTAGNISVISGEYETNGLGGILVHGNNDPVSIVNASFYDNGISYVGSDIELSYFSKDVRVADCRFTNGPVANELGKNIYVIGCTRGKIENNTFNGTSGVGWSIYNILIDGHDTTFGVNSRIVVRGNQMLNDNSGSLGVQITGASTDCVVENNVSDASFVEAVATSVTPDRNTFRNNVLVPGQGATYTLVGANSRVFGDVAAPSTSSSTGWPGQRAFDGTYEYVCVATNTWRRVATSSF